MKTLSVLLLSSLFSITALGANIKVDNCWNGHSNAEQKNNLATCRAQVKDGQKCSDNLWEHGRGAYDVCLIEADGEMKLIKTFKGDNQSTQDANLKKCKEHVENFQFCVSNLWIHKQGAYDVCLMQAE